jgi:hypothetical protein
MNMEQGVMSSHSKFIDRTANSVGQESGFLSLSLLSMNVAIVSGPPAHLTRFQFPRNRTFLLRHHLSAYRYLVSEIIPAVQRASLCFPFAVHLLSSACLPDTIPRSPSAGLCTVCTRYRVCQKYICAKIQRRNYPRQYATS